jgi:tetratricopeptide (TPR) repeat protein
MMPYILAAFSLAAVFIVNLILGWRQKQESASKTGHQKERAADDRNFSLQPANAGETQDSTERKASESLSQWLQELRIPAVPPKAQIRSHRAQLPGNAAQQAQFQSINTLFGGSVDRFVGKEEAFNDACDVLSDYLEVVETAARDPTVDRTTITRDAALHCKALLLDVFPFSAEAYRTLAIIFQHEGLHEKAVKCCDYALDCFEATDPELINEAVEISWGFVEQRPYLRTLHSKAMCLEKAGKYKKAKNTYRKLLDLNPNDNLGCRYSFFYLCLRSGDLDTAEAFSKENKDDQDASFLWGGVILKYMHFQLGHLDEKKLDSQLVKAVDQNPFVPGRLLSKTQLPPPPACMSVGGRDEAISVANGIKDTWDSVDGIDELLESAMNRGGRKPPSSKDMFDLLTHRNVLVRISTGLETIMTTNVRCMRGRGTEEFYVPTGTKDHVEGAPLVMFENTDDAKWHEITFDDIVDVPFWKLLLERKQKKQKSVYCDNCLETCTGTLACGACGVTEYCSKACQKADWKGEGTNTFAHRYRCKRLIKK